MWSYWLVNGLKRLKYPCLVNVHNATEGLLHCASQLLRPRTEYLFVTEVHRGTAKNADLWQEFQELSKIHWITMCWVEVRSHHMDSREARYSARDVSACVLGIPSTSWAGLSPIKATETVGTECNGTVPSSRASEMNAQPEASALNPDR